MVKRGDVGSFYFLSTGGYRATHQLLAKLELIESLIMSLLFPDYSSHFNNMCFMAVSVEWELPF